MTELLWSEPSLQVETGTGRTPLFSVVVPAFNAERFIEATLKSILNQRVQNFELIVVDDGSTDRTAEVVASFGERVRLIRQENAGCHGARNRGIAAARGAFIAFMDADDLWFPWTLATYQRVIEQHRDAAVILARPRFFEGEQAPSNCHEDALHVRRWDDFFAGGDQTMWTGTSVMVVRRDKLTASGRSFELGCLSDLDFLLRIGGLGPFVKIDRPITVAYRKHGANLSGSGARVARAMRTILDQEWHGVYGGNVQRFQRRRIISLHAALCAKHRLRAGDLRHAWLIYRRAVPMHLEVGRFDAVWKWPLHFVQHLLCPLVSDHAVGRLPRERSA